MNKHIEKYRAYLKAMPSDQLLTSMNLRAMVRNEIEARLDAIRNEIDTWEEGECLCPQCLDTIAKTIRRDDEALDKLADQLAEEEDNNDDDNQYEDDEDEDNENGDSIDEES